MGVSLQSFDLKVMALKKGGICQSFTGSHCGKAMMWRQQKKQRVMRRRPKCLMKRRAVLEGSRRPKNEVKRKVDALKMIVPNGKSLGLDGLFRETADYIVGLQMQVKIMEIMVKVLSGSNA